MACDQQQFVGDASNLACLIKQDQALAEQALADARFGQLDTLGHRNNGLVLDAVKVIQYFGVWLGLVDEASRWVIPPFSAVAKSGVKRQAPVSGSE